MSRGHGRTQRDILAVLARPDPPLTTRQIVFVVTREQTGRGLGDFPLSGADCDHYGAAVNFRRALRRLKAEGLVESVYYADQQGRPHVWSITGAGRDLLKARGESS
jgi:hypothetical protein